MMEPVHEHDEQGQDGGEGGGGDSSQCSFSCITPLLSKEDDSRGDEQQSDEGESSGQGVLGESPHLPPLTKRVVTTRGIVQDHLRQLEERHGSVEDFLNIIDNQDDGPRESEVVEALARVREQPWPMEKRRKAKEELIAKLAGKEMKWYSTQPVVTVIRKGKSHLLSLLCGSYMWWKILKPIEGRHGTSVVAVFNFLRAMIQLDLILALILLFGVVLPGAALAGRREHQGYGWIDTGHSQNSTKNTCTELTLEISTEIWECNSKYMEHLKSLQGKRRSVKHVIQDFLQGTGFLEWSVMFSGYYPTFVNSDIYLISLAHILSVLAVYLVSLIYVVYFVAKFLRQSPQLKHNHNFTYEYSKITFTGWDFAISQSAAARTQQNIILSEIKAAYDDEKYMDNKRKRTRKDWIKLYLVRFMINLFVIIIIIGGWVVIYFVVKDPDRRESDGFIAKYIDTIIISAIDFIYPMIFSVVVSVEYYRGRTELLVTLFRCVFVRLTSLAVLIITELSVISKQSPSCEIYDEGYMCWETHMGQQLYSLLILEHFLMQLFMTFVVNVGMKNLERCKNPQLKNMSRMEFYVPDHVLDIIHAQSILWLSVVYAPLMAATCWLYFVVLFGLKLFTVSVTCIPSTRVIRASSSSAMFSTVLCLALALCGIASAVGLFQLSPSKACSTFRGLASTWDVITYYICRMNGNAWWVRWLLWHVVDVGVLAVVMVVAAMSLVYYVIRLKAHTAMLKRLERKLKETAKENAFLIGRVQEGDLAQDYITL